MRTMLLAAALVGPTPSPSAPAPPSPALQAAQELVARVTPRVEAIRGLKFKRPVAVGFADAARVKAHFEKRLSAGGSEGQMRAQDAAFVQLGLLPSGVTLTGGMLSTLEEQARGYYDPGSDTFYLLDGPPPPGVEAIVAHELTHALDDQHFDIDALIERAGDDDATLALASVLEGSGTLVMAVFLAQEMAAGRMPATVALDIQAREAPAAARLRETAPYFQRSLTAPYLLGVTFLLRGDPGRLRHGVSARDIDRAFAELPRSTEQVLHAEKYWDPAARDLPRALSLPDLAPRLGPGFRLEGGGRLGELVAGVLVGAPTPEAAAGLDPARWHAPAAAGMRGDLWQRFGDGTRGVSVWASAWDDETQALEFLAALKALPGRRAYRHAEKVLLVAGDLDRERADALAAAALAGMTEAR